MSAPSLKEQWELETKQEAFREQLRRWDKKLYHLNDEMLYYVLMRVESIINSRAEQQRQDTIINKSGNYWP